MNLIKNTLEYIVILVSEFAKTYHLTDTQAYRYMQRYGAIDFFIEHYNVAHTQSFSDMVTTAKDYCKRNGGGIA